MATEIKNVDLHIKEEIIYADITDVPEIYGTIISENYLTAEDAIAITSAGVDCQEIVVGAEDGLSNQKIEAEEDGSYYENNVYDQDSSYNPNNSFKIYSASESSPLKTNTKDNMADGYYNNNIYLSSNKNNDIYRHHSLRSKQLELLRVKQLGGKHRIVSVKSDNDEWYPDEKQGTSYSEDMHMVDDDNDVDYEVNKKSRYSNRIGYSNFIRASKPRKRVFAHRLQWRDKDMKEAMRYVEEKHMTIRGAAKKFNVPYSTLKDRVRGRVRHGTKPGVKTVLSPEEEAELVRFVQQMEECGFDLLCIDIRERASELLNLNQRYNSPYRDFIPGHNWLAGFLKRHPGLEIKRASNRIVPPSSSKLKMLLKRFFEVSLHAYRKVWGDDRSSQIFTMAVTQLPSLPKITIIITASADGTLLDPYVVGRFNRANLYQMEQIFPGAHFISSSGDVMSRDKLLLLWFRDYFIQRVKARSVVKNYVLFLNQPIRNISIRLVEMSVDLGINLVGMPTNLTNVLQPLNSSFVSELDNLTQKQIKWVIVHRGSNGVVGDEDEVVSGGDYNLNGFQVAQVFKRVFDERDQLSPEIRLNFQECGLFPLNSRVITGDKLNALAATATTLDGDPLYRPDVDADEDYFGQITEFSPPSYKDGAIIGTKSGILNQSNGCHGDVVGGGGGCSGGTVVDEEMVVVGRGGQDRRDEDHGLQLLSELSTAVRTPSSTVNQSPHHHHQRRDLSPISRHPSVNRARWGPDREKNEKKSYGAIRRQHRYQQHNQQHPRQQQQRSQRLKRLAAGASEKFIKEVMEEEIRNGGDDEEDDDEYETEDGNEDDDDGGGAEGGDDDRGGNKELKSILAFNNKRRKLNHHHQFNNDGHHDDDIDMNGDDNDTDDGYDDDDLEDGSCSRTRPADVKYRLRKFKTLTREDLAIVDKFNDHHGNHQAYKQMYDYDDIPILESKIPDKPTVVMGRLTQQPAIIQPPPQQHNRHFIATVGRTKHHHQHHHQHQAKHQNDNHHQISREIISTSCHDNDIINQAVDSILPEQVVYNNKYDVVVEKNVPMNLIQIDGKYFENLNPLSSIKIPSPTTTTFPKTPKLQYCLKKPLPQPQQNVVECKTEQQQQQQVGIITEEIPIHIHNIICNDVADYTTTIYNNNINTNVVETITSTSLMTNQQSNNFEYASDLHIIIEPRVREIKDINTKESSEMQIDQLGESISENDPDLKMVEEHLLSDIISDANNEICKITLNNDYEEEEEGENEDGRVASNDDVINAYQPNENILPVVTANETTTTLSQSSSQLQTLTQPLSSLPTSLTTTSTTATTTSLPTPSKQQQQQLNTTIATTTATKTIQNSQPSSAAAPISSPPSQTDTPTVQIQIGDETYDLDKKVKMTKSMKIGGQQVQIIRIVSLKEALDNSNIDDPDLIDCGLELIDN